MATQTRPKAHHPRRAKSRHAAAGSTRPSPPPSARGLARQQAIIDAAVLVVGAQGVAALTHREVARVGRVPLAATTYYFASKDELVAAAFATLVAHRLRELDAIDAAIPPRLTPETAATIWASMIASRAERQRGLALAEFELHLEASRRPELRALHTKWERRAVEVTAKAMIALGSPQPAADAAIVLACMTGLELGELAAPTHQASEALLAPLFRRLLTGLLHTAAPRTQRSAR